jgi:2,4-dienoyl-CoA reductase-like NADH-dependent reductase (Old Yellow Enzyme family)/thioredoxin reductase
MTDYPLLFRPLKLGGVTLKNRLFSAPTSLAELSAEGRLTPDNILYYKLRAAGGCAAVTIGDAIVDGSTGRAHPRQVVLDDPDIVPSLTMAADAIHAHGAAASIQLDHGGALCAPEFVKDGKPRAPSDFIYDGVPVYGLSVSEIEGIVEAFGRSAEVVKSCGFDMLQIHSGHGWLLHQFISPATNKREDEFGGSFENRMRFPLMVIDRVREAVGKDFPIEVRISADERIAGGSGYGFGTGLEIAKAFDGKADLIHVSVGNNNDWESAMLMISSCFTEPQLNGGYAAEIKKNVKTPILCVGAFTDVTDIETFFENSGVDAVALGRALLADPFLPKKALLGRAEDITPCIRCNECLGSMYTTRTIRCTVNPLIGREREYFSPLPLPKVKKRVLIAGGGPAGLTAAIECTKRGHEVILCEQSGKLGGSIFYADGVDFKAGIGKLRYLLVRRVERSGAEIRLGTRVDAALVKDINPDVLIAAVGGKPIVPPIPGADSPGIVKGPEIRNDTPIGRRVVIVGGGLVGCEIALHLSEEGHDVTVVEMRDEFAPEANPLHRYGLLWRMKGNENLHIKTSMRVTEIRKDGVTAESTEGAKHIFSADTVILSVGIKADAAQAEALRGLVPEYYVIGDGKKARKLMQAIQEGYDAAVDLGLSG